MRCWYCKEAEMIEERQGVQQWYKCPSCGATHTDLPVPEASALGRTWLDEVEIPHYHSHPVRKSKGKKK